MPVDIELPIKGIINDMPPQLVSDNSYLGLIDQSYIEIKLPQYH